MNRTFQDGMVDVTTVTPQTIDRVVNVTVLCFDLQAQLSNQLQDYTLILPSELCHVGDFRMFSDFRNAMAYANK